MNNYEKQQETIQLDPYEIWAKAKRLIPVGTNRRIAEKLNRSEAQVGQAFKGKQPGLLRVISNSLPFIAKELYKDLIHKNLEEINLQLQQFSQEELNEIKYEINKLVDEKAA